MSDSSRAGSETSAITATIPLLLMMMTFEVAGIVGRADTLACLFFLSSFLLYHKYLMSGLAWQLGLSLAASVLSMLSKEHGITVLAVMALHDWHQRRFQVQAVQHSISRTNTNANTKSVISSNVVVVPITNGIGRARQQGCDASGDGAAVDAGSSSLSSSSSSSCTPNSTSFYARMAPIALTVSEQ
ncbi:unnamed protein product [Notodromas monacha]|uniref:Uncharacterized protein n=1 Tax=Notodromas monacha TaxID=399045 RepID=A0A7R9GIQ3_9CRUS|nr:unnamed protein product [Notodromas monacha]CAG0922699.1 unnamed protein product [Notodromas monacha]